MSLFRASKHVVGCNANVRSSYVEISRFVRTRHPGIALRAAACPASSACLFTSSRVCRDAFIPDEKLQRALHNFKETLEPTLWDDAIALRPEIGKSGIGKEVITMGIIMNRRDINKKLSFATLRNPRQEFAIQVVSSYNEEGSEAAEAHSRLRSLRDWTPVLIKGTTKERKAPKTDTSHPVLMCDTREIELEAILPLNEIDKDIIVNEETSYGPELRHLQLRTSKALITNLIWRQRATRAAIDWMTKKNWIAIETPLLFKSTPEGAREFLVPSRNKGFAYALPQSPQQYKQILMASGFDKYYQFARCFRDEDLRADRQPEFTQLDMEMSWAGDNEVMEEVEQLLRYLLRKLFNIPLTFRFPRLTYQQAMALYGSDKPDLRCPATIHSITDLVPADFKSKISSLENPAIEAFKLTLSDDAAKNRAIITAFLDSPAGQPFLNNPDGQPALFFGDASQPMGGHGPLGYQYSMESPQEVRAEHGDMLVVQARKNEPFNGFGSTMLGNLRVALFKEAMSQGLIPRMKVRYYKFVWITDFPLFTPTTDAEPGQGGAAGLSSTHHPFTAPKTAEDVDLLLTDPSKAIAAHYDIVVNGVELGGGSRRVHNADVQEFIFRDVLKMEPERIEDFRHLLDALRSGCPPHAGLALGWDRLVAVLCGAESVRDVIAFPKTGSGEDAMVKAPNRLTEEQLRTYHLQLRY